MKITIADTRELDLDQVVALYRANKWSAADKPEQLLRALINSDALYTAWDGADLVGLGNAISDGHLVVYYPHLLIHPDYQGRGIGQLIASKMQERYAGFHMQMLTADGRAIDFYEKMGFTRAGHTQSMWIYNGDEH